MSIREFEKRNHEFMSSFDTGKSKEIANYRAVELRRKKRSSYNKKRRECGGKNIPSKFSLGFGVETDMGLRNMMKVFRESDSLIVKKDLLGNISK